VFLQRYEGPAERMQMGVTPLTIARLPRADYLLTLEKAGFAPASRAFSFMPVYLPSGEPVARPLALQVRLAAASAVPKDMVFVVGGPYRLGGFQRPSDRLVTLSDFVIDRYEVSNREFAEFVRAGGYRRKELWKHPFVDEGRRLSFEAAIERFRDTTGLPGPRHWSGGAPPAGRENHPVTDVTWYEAAAFAEWKGKKLPTVFQWEKAARPPNPIAIVQSFPWGFVGENVDASDRANFVGKGTMPVDSMPFGAGPYGSHHMAGNVAEWCRNPIGSGYVVRGGSFTDNLYAFGQTAGLPPFYSAPTLGFRCMSGGSICVRVQPFPWPVEIPSSTAGAP
jgi:formylglycine-generating enzyme required for sulfatase activity